MIRKTLLTVCLLSLSFVLGCQGEKKPASLINTLKKIQAKQLEYSLGDTCTNFDIRWDLDNSLRDEVIAHNPGVDNQQLYLTAVDKNGTPACDKPMKIVVKDNGKLALYSPYCGELKPVAVEGDKVIVE